MLWEKSLVIIIVCFNVRSFEGSSESDGSKDNSPDSSDDIVFCPDDINCKDINKTRTSTYEPSQEVTKTSKFVQTFSSTTKFHETDFELTMSPGTAPPSVTTSTPKPSLKPSPATSPLMPKPSTSTVPSTSSLAPEPSFTPLSTSVPSTSSSLEPERSPTPSSTTVPSTSSSLEPERSPTPSSTTVSSTSSSLVPEPRSISSSTTVPDTSSSLEPEPSTTPSSTTIPSTSVQSSPDPRKLCPDNMNLSQTYCYVAKNISDYDTYRCPYAGFTFNQDAFSELMPNGEQTWVPALRLNSSQKFTWIYPEKYGQQVEDIKQVPENDYSCLILNEGLLQPADCTKTYMAICLYDYSASTYCKRKPYANTAPSDFTMNKCYYRVDNQMNRTDASNGNNLAEAEILYQATKLSSILGSTCWIGAIRKDNKYYWESSSKTIDYTRDLNIAGNGNYGAINTSSWIFYDEDTRLKCAIYEAANKVTSSRIDITLKTYSDGFLIVGIENIQNVHNLELYCFSGDKYNIKIDRSLQVIYPNRSILLPYSVFPKYYWCETYHLQTSEIQRSNVVVAFNNSNYNTYAMDMVITNGNTKLGPDDIDNITKHLFDIISQKIRELFNIYPIEIVEITSKQIHCIYHLSTTLINPNDTNQQETIQSWFKNSNCNVTKVKNAIFCPEDTNVINGVVLTWKKSRIGENVSPKELCVTSDSIPVTRNCTGDFIHGAEWAQVSGTCDQEKISNLTQSLHDLFINTVKLDELCKGFLTQSHTDKSNFTVVDIDLSSKIVEKIAERAFDESYNVSEVLDSVGNIMLVGRETLRDAQTLLNSTDNILYQLDKILITNANLNDFNLATDKILVKVADLNVIAGYAISQTNEPQPIPKSASSEDVVNSKPKLAVFLPNPDENFNFQPDFRREMIMTFYFSDALFNDDNYKNETSDIFVSIVIPDYHGFFKTPLQVIYQGNEGQNQACAFWDYGINDEQLSVKGHWESNTKGQSSKQMYICSFSHLTHFALLVSEKEYDKVNNLILSVITIIGCSLSLCGVFFIFLTAMVFKSWRNQQSNIILMNFLASVVLTYSMLFVADEVSDDGGWCVICGMLLHYSLVSQFLWMFIISYLQYRRFVVVFNSYISRVILKCCLLGWVAPAIPVLIVLIIPEEGYHKNEADICYLSGATFIIAVIAPLIIILTLNMCFFVKIILALTKLKPESSACQEDETKRILRQIYLLFFLVGASWIFGLLLVFDANLLFTYLFCMSCSLQGFVVALSFILSSSTRKYWVECREINAMFGCCKSKWDE